MSLQLDQSQTTYAVPSYFYGAYYKGQTFTAGLTGRLDKISLYLAKLGSPSNFIVEIRDESGDLPGTNLLASQEISASLVSAWETEGIDWIDIIFSSPPDIVASTKYSITFHIKNDEGDASNYYKPGYANASPYANGRYCYSSNSGSTWLGGTQDFCFKTYVETEPETEVLSDIDNDFRMIKEWALDDVNNDFRMVGTFAVTDINNDFRMTGASLYDVNNDFRMTGTLLRVDVNNDFRSRLETLNDINNDFRTVKEVVDDVNNDFRLVKEEVYDVSNIFISVAEQVSDVNNDFRSKAENTNNINNDFRMISPWQIPTTGGVDFISAGKTEVKVYINSVEQTDVNIDSVSINEILNGASTAYFELVRAYDGSNPASNSIVQIKYKNFLLFYGKITETNSDSSSESIKVSCQGRYWDLNKNRKYFYVGRKPRDSEEFYYSNIRNALTGMGFNYNIGNFVPQTMNLYGIGQADAISELVQNAGNYSWFISPNGTKKLWIGGSGSVINLEEQQLGTNLGLYQVIVHNIKEVVINLVNRLYVKMGNKVTKKIPNDNKSYSEEGSGKSSYGVFMLPFAVPALPMWISSTEHLAKEHGYGWDYQKNPQDYKITFRKFELPSNMNWSKLGISHIEIRKGSPFNYNYNEENISEGYSIAWEGTTPILTFSNPQVTKFFEGATLSALKTATVIVHGWYEMPIPPAGMKQTSLADNHYHKYNVDSEGNGVTLLPISSGFLGAEDMHAHSIVDWVVQTVYGHSHIIWHQDSPDKEPDPGEELMPLSFFTSKVGSYAETITEDLELSNLSIQEGYNHVYRDSTGELVYDIFPSWNDTAFANDLAYWQLSKTAYPKKTGTITLTIDAMLYYRIDLSKRVKMGTTVSPINITSIDYNFNSWTANLNLESAQIYRRNVNIPYRGE